MDGGGASGGGGTFLTQLGLEGYDGLDKYAVTGTSQVREMRALTQFYIPPAQCISCCVGPWVHFSTSSLSSDGRGARVCAPEGD